MPQETQTFITSNIIKLWIVYLAHITIQGLIKKSIQPDLFVDQPVAVLMCAATLNPLALV